MSETRTLTAARHSAPWVRPKPATSELRTDVLLAAVLLLASITTALLYVRIGIFEDPAPLWLSALALGLATVPLALRRRYPVPVAVLVFVGFFVAGQFGVPEVLVINICLFLALYSVGAWESNREFAFWARFGITVAAFAWLITSLIISSSDADAFPGVSRSGLFSAYATFAVLQLITNLMYFAAAFYFGERAWRSARTVALLEARGTQLDLERRTSAAQAVTLDRIAIARELHDAVAHHVSIMGIQAAAARRTLDRDPATASAALETIEESAHSAIEELRRLVHTLREPNPEGIASTLGIAQLPELVAESQSAGTNTTLIVTGETRPLPMLIDVALYRVAQEALTNVRKHAGRGAEATVRLRFSDAGAEVEVSDTGVRQTLDTPSALPGLGLRGMRERIGAVGGSVIASRRETGGFLVRASVPYDTAWLSTGGSPMNDAEVPT